MATSFPILKQNLLPYQESKRIIQDQKNDQIVKVFQDDPFKGKAKIAIKQIEEYILKRPKCNCVNCTVNR